MDRGNEQPVVSIIVPMYNAEAVISRCVDSILKQNFKAFELILVDDGSRDASGSICEQYAAHDSRVQVIHTENTGVSHSRNIAMQKARGTYLQFVDSDDWLAPEATGLLVSSMETQSCDLVVSDFYRVIDNRIAHKGDIQENGLLSREEFASNLIEKPADFYYGVVWNKLYKKSLIEQFHMKMDPEISWCEDFMFNLEYICHCETVYVLRVPIYYYVKTRNSLSTQGINFTKTIKMKTSMFEYYKRFYRAVFNEKDYEKSRLQVYRFLVDAADDGIVPPALLGGIRLGEERTQANPKFLEKEVFLSDAYLQRKCLETCLQSAILCYDLTPEEAYLLLFLSRNHDTYSRKELADLIGQPKRKLDSTLQKLKAHGYITWTELTAANGTQKATARQLDICLLPGAEPVVHDLKAAQDYYYESLFSGFSDADMAAYDALSRRLKANMVQMLS